MNRSTTRYVRRSARFAASDTRYSCSVGLPTTITILGNKISPRLCDLYLGKAGVKSQQTREQRDQKPPTIFTNPLRAIPAHMDVLTRAPIIEARSSGRKCIAGSFSADSWPGLLAVVGAWCFGGRKNSR
jgi:hypothetical protein